MLYKTSNPSIMKVTLLSLLFLFSCKENTGQHDSGHKYTNALINETSPYLLQHAHNPVNWQPWSQEALNTAKKENKLVLVSIGYSSCHWCHVMEEETFEDEAIAKIMNENFINIKVDREERPDVDHVYMTALQLIKGNGGWPLNMIVLPNGKPLYGGTYHTNKQWGEVLTKVSELYKNDPKKAGEYADMVAAGIAEANVIEPTDNKGMLTQRTLHESVDVWSENWDLDWGGDQGTQKFMLPGNLDFLIDYEEISNSEKARRHVKNTLDKIAQGGVYDHLAGGFFRYSTDQHWKVPHFEKMLYDNAQLLSLYAKAYLTFEEPAYKKLVYQTVAFLDREMKNPEGGYYAAIDADSEGEEGKFYVWTATELKAVLTEDFELFAKYYHIQPENLWEDGNYVLYRTMTDKEFIAENNIERTELETFKGRVNALLLKAREKRVRPGTDDKILTSWNALLISGFVDAYKAFGEKQFLEKAKSVFTFIKEKSFQNGHLRHSYKEGDKRTDGFLEDYAYMIDASLNLYQVTMDDEYLNFAEELSGITEKEYSDSASGMYHYSNSDALVAKIIKTDDGVLPSPNAVMAHNLFQLGHIQYNRDLWDKAESMLSSMVPLVSEHAQSYSKWNALLQNIALPYFEIAVVGKNAPALVQKINKMNLSNALVVGSVTASELPLFKGRYVEDETFIYVCQDATCKLPVETVEEALVQMDNF